MDKGPAPDDFERSPCVTAGELISHLTVGEGTLVDNNRFLFRGVYDASFPLLASAFRNNPPAFGKLAETEFEQFDLERKALQRFYDAAYHEGLAIPNWESATAYVRGMVAPPGPPAFVALAQHHGTPTRFLDWTRDALVAAYFAASTVTPTEASDMAVWKLDTAWERGFQWRIVSIPYDVNQNARAQRGVFIDYQMARLNATDGIRLSSMIEAGRAFPFPTLNYFTKFTLPRTEAGKLLRLLRARRISAATLFPGYYGAARHERDLNAFGE